MKHSDIHVTVPNLNHKNYLNHFRKMFFLAGYLALMAVATGVASPKPPTETTTILGLDPLDSWPTPLIMKCEDLKKPSPMNFANVESRSCSPILQTAEDKISKQDSKTTALN